MAQPRLPNNTAEGARKYAKFLEAVLQMAVCIAIGTIGGKKFDEWVSNTRPWGMLVGVLLGLAMAFYLFFKRIASEK